MSAATALSQKDASNNGQIHSVVSCKLQVTESDFPSALVCLWSLHRLAMPQMPKIQVPPICVEWMVDTVNLSVFARNPLTLNRLAENLLAISRFYH